MKTIREYFVNLHDVECNQKYDKRHPYSFHLDMVYEQAKYFDKIILPPVNVDGLFFKAACYGHDAIEDARVSYNELKEKFGEPAAEVIYLCTENKGRNRADRKGDDFYAELRTNEMAVFVKLCDIVANVKYSLLTNSSMFKKYEQEYFDKVKPQLLPYYPQYGKMFEYLEKLFAINL